MDEAVLRHIGSEETGTLEPVRRGRNIIAVIGIDDYQYWRKLHNAVSDAQGVLKLFLTLGFQELVPPLLNAQATPEAIRSLVLDQLGSQLQEDDSVILFFSGHGHTETKTVGSRKVQTGYLIPVNGKLPEESRFSAYIRLDSFLEELAALPARHVMVILDACYSGFALGQSVTVLKDYTRYTEDLSRRFSRQVIASAMHDQPALDNGPILGHSLFTGTLIEALELGKADPDNKGFVTSSELALYLQKAVGSDSGSKQTPDFGAFDLHDRGEMVISLRSERQNLSQAQECFKIGERIFAMGRHTGDVKRFVFAAKQYREAVKFSSLAKQSYPEAELGLGKALFVSGETAKAMEVLERLAIDDANPCRMEALLYLGMAQARLKQFEPAAGTLDKWLMGNPTDINHNWLSEYSGWLRSAAQNPAGRRYALLIGIDQYRLEKAFPLKGCENDVAKLIKPVLTDLYGFSEENITMLTNEQATRKRILLELNRLKDIVLPGDTVLVQFSGHSVPASQKLTFGRNDQNIYLIFHDTSDHLGYLVNGMTAKGLHRLMQAIPTQQKTLILDTHASHELIEMAKTDGNYNLILASDTAEIAYEWKVPVNGEEVPCGMLTGALYQSLQKIENPAALSYQEWIAPAIEIAHQASSQKEFERPQTPYFVGLPEQKVFVMEDPYLPVFEFMQRDHWPETNLDQIKKRYNLLQAITQADIPQIHFVAGRALLSKGAYAEGRAAFKLAVEQRQGNYTEAWLAMSAAFAQEGNFRQAHETMEKALPPPAAALNPEVERLKNLLTPLQEVKRQVTIFLMDSSKSQGGRFVSQAARQIDLNFTDHLSPLRALLQQKFGVEPENFLIIPEEEATRERIMDEITRAANDPAGSPTMLCFFNAMVLPGAGKMLTSSSPIELKELEDAAKQTGRLTIWIQKSFDNR